MTTINPYAAPRSQLESGENESTVSIDVLKKIKGAWIAGLISGSLTLVVTFFAMAGMSVLGYSAVELIDVVLVFGLTFGIYKKSRTCAVLMLVYFVISKAFLMMEMRSASPMIVGLIFMYFYTMGVVGTFQYHRRGRTTPENAPAR
ncbi:MAG TPA: hypothetical protein VGF58_05525 [Burkholderiales bacterium]|jgi:serine/threonine-protein kinase